MGIPMNQLVYKGRTVEHLERSCRGSNGIPVARWAGIPAHAGGNSRAPPRTTSRSPSPTHFRGTCIISPTAFTGWRSARWSGGQSLVLGFLFGHHIQSPFVVKMVVLTRSYYARWWIMEEQLRDKTGWKLDFLWHDPRLSQRLGESPGVNQKHHEPNMAGEDCSKHSPTTLW